MPICTYLSNQEYEMFKSITDKELNELLQEIRIKYPDILLEEYFIPKRTGLFKNKIKIETYYTLYNDLGYGEVQIINFENGTRNRSEIIYAYFYGLLSN
jgi:hypothetical protein